VKALMFVAVLTVGCGPGADRRVAPAYDATGKLTRLSFDSNADGQPDMVASMDGSAVRVVEVDEDGDGRFDRTESYDGGSAPLRVERVARRGATIVRREAYERGVLVSAQEDRDADGRIDRWETYAGGGLKTLELDSTGAGRPDRRLTYDGDQVRIEDQIANRR
jgi:hypothetical protein